jgi:hypothetical protein
MRWDKGNGDILDAQDNEDTEKWMLRCGYKKLGNAPEEPNDEPTGAEKEEQSIAPEDVGEMPKDILGG